MLCFISIEIINFKNIFQPFIFLDKKSTRTNPGQDAGTKICPSGVIINGHDSVTTDICKSAKDSGQSNGNLDLEVR